MESCSFGLASKNSALRHRQRISRFVQVQSIRGGDEMFLRHGSYLYGSYNEYDKWDNDNDYAIQRRHDLFGIIHFKHSNTPTDDDDYLIEPQPALEWVLGCYYDSIFRLGDIFVLSARGKVGAIRCVDDTVEWIVPCEYYAVKNYLRVVIFFKQDEQVCYFKNSHMTKTFSEVSVDEGYKDNIFACDPRYYYIIDANTENILWMCEKNDPHLSPYTLFGLEPCLIPMGTVINDVPMYFDCANGIYMVPTGENKLDYISDFYGEMVPIIIQGRNVINIVDNSEKVYAGNYKECFQRPLDENNGFDEVTVEIKVTLKRGAHTEEHLYPIPHGTFVPGDLLDHLEW